MKTEEQVFSELTNVIRDVFVAPNAAITRDTVAEDIPGWDSTSHVVLVLTIEDHFNIALDPEMELSNVGELADEIYKSVSANG